jgi:hypothetical protein
MKEIEITLEDYESIVEFVRVMRTECILRYDKEILAKVDTFIEKNDGVIPDCGCEWIITHSK